MNGNPLHVQLGIQHVCIHCNCLLTNYVWYGLLFVFVSFYLMNSSTNMANTTTNRYQSLSVLFCRFVLRPTICGHLIFVFLKTKLVFFLLYFVAICGVTNYFCDCCMFQSNKHWSLCLSFFFFLVCKFYPIIVTSPAYLVFVVSIFLDGLCCDLFNGLQHFFFLLYERFFWNVFWHLFLWQRFPITIRVTYGMFLVFFYF